MRMNPGKAIQNKINGVKQNFADYKKLDSRDKKTYWKEFLLNNALYILLIVAIIYTYIQNSNFLSAASIVNIISLSAANLPIACGIAGCIVLTGTDLSAGRVVGLTACITASLMQSVTYATKMFPNLPVLPIPLVILIVLLVGGIVGWVNGFFVAKFQLHPFIVTLATQLIVYGLLLMYIMINGNNGQPLSGLDQHFNDVVKGSVISFNAGGARIAIPNYVWLAALIVVIMWFIWNKTTFGKNMFAVGSNPEAAKVSGVNVMRTTILVHTLAGAMYGLTGFIESSRIGSNTANTGLNYECDAIAACVIGGVSFVGGTGKISGVVLGVFLLRIIFVAKFQLHPFIVTLATQLIVYGLLLMYIMINGNNGQPLSGLDQHFNDVVKGSVISFNAGGARIAIPNYVWLAALIVVIMWFIWNKTTFGKNMFAVGSNPEAAKVSGVNVMRTTILVHTLAGAMYGLTGFIESSRIGSNTANTGLNYECDAIAACVIGGVSFVGGTGKISGVVLGVFLLRIIFVALNFLSINMNMQYVIKGLIILVACAIDMRKYLVRK